jgi:hypothetical protein
MRLVWAYLSGGSGAWLIVGVAPRHVVIGFISLILQTVLKPSPRGRGQSEGALLLGNSPSPQPSPRGRGSVFRVRLKGES